MLVSNGFPEAFLIGLLKHGTTAIAWGHHVEIFSHPKRIAVSARHDNGFTIVC
jgi:hypothetical protein